MGKLNRRQKPLYNTYIEAITSTGIEFCFVCDKKFKKGQRKVCIKGGNDGLYRHTRCDAYSEGWKQKFGCVIKRL